MRWSRTNKIAFRATARSTNRSLVNLLNVSQQIAVLRECAITLKARRCAPTQMNGTHMLLKITIFAKLFATSVADKSLLAIMNGANVSIEITTITKPLLARRTLVRVDFAWIVKPVDVLAQHKISAKPLQTRRTLRSVWSIENTRFFD